MIHFLSSSKSYQFWKLMKLPVLAASEVVNLPVLAALKGASFGSF